MHLKSIKFNNLGPFKNGEVIELDPNVTVLTGRNDVGKSIVLKLIERIFNFNTVEESHVNIDSFFNRNSSWQVDNKIYADIHFTTNSFSHKYIKPKNTSIKILPGDEIKIRVKLAPDLKSEKRFETLSILRGQDQNPYNIHRWEEFSLVNFLKLDEIIHSTLNISDLNSVETKFLRIAFGGNFQEKLKDQNSQYFHLHLEKANDRVNREISKLLPPSMKFEIIINRGSDNQDSNTFNVYVEDDNRGLTPTELRGSGVQKILSAVAQLVDGHPDTAVRYILIDEPENSLHADAQHMLKRFLEELSEKDNIQIIYSTHSPSMINSFYPERVRLITRYTDNNIAFSKIKNSLFEHNFTEVADELGLNPLDSLTLAPINIVVEGKTEQICLPYLIKRLIQENSDKYNSIKSILSLIKFIDGEGDSFKYWIKMSESLGLRSLAYIDGDKLSNNDIKEFSEEFPGVPLIQLNDNEEFEEIIPKPDYFKVLEKQIGIKNAYEEFKNWVSDKGIPEHVSFTTNVDNWLANVSNSFSYNKPAVMKEALTNIAIESISIDTIEELLDRIKSISNEL